MARFFSNGLLTFDGPTLILVMAAIDIVSLALTLLAEEDEWSGGHVSGLLFEIVVIVAIMENWTNALRKAYCFTVALLAFGIVFGGMMAAAHCGYADFLLFNRTHVQEFGLMDSMYEMLRAVAWKCVYLWALNEASKDCEDALDDDEESH